jgi:hypothetical protein
MQIDWSAPVPDEPSNCLTRAGTHLRMAKQGFRDMSESGYDRAILGFCSVAVFGRSITLALQHLRTWDRETFDRWYRPWRDEMAKDPLCRFFYKLRTDVLHGGVPTISFVLGSSGPNAPAPGTIRVVGRAVPTEHRDEAIEDTSALNLCRLYIAYLEEMFASAAEVIWPVQDRWQAEQDATRGQLDRRWDGGRCT